MLFRKKKTIAPKPFSRVMPSRWMAEYSGVLPHCIKQNVSLHHHLLCSKVDGKHRQMLLDAGIKMLETEQPTHVVWCVCRFSKDHGEIRMVFRRYLYLPTMDGLIDPDWIAFKLTQSIYFGLVGTKDFKYITPCTTIREYPWCAKDDIFSDYWDTEISVRIKRIITLAKAK